MFFVILFLTFVCLNFSSCRMSNIYCYLVSTKILICSYSWYILSCSPNVFSSTIFCIIYWRCESFMYSIYRKLSNKSPTSNKPSSSRISQSLLYDYCMKAKLGNYCFTECVSHYYMFFSIVLYWCFGETFKIFIFFQLEPLINKHCFLLFCFLLLSVWIFPHVECRTFIASQH